MMQLNPSQEDAVTRDSKRLLMLAGPGTGKTETLTERISHFIRERDVLPNQVLMFTYTNKAASNMTQRVRGKLLAHQANILSGTFHSLAYRFIRQECIPKDLMPDFKVLPEHHATRLRKEAVTRFNDQNPALSSLLRELHLNPSDLLELYERKTKLNLQPEFLTGTKDEIRSHEGEIRKYVEGAAATFAQLKQDYQVFDFNDLLFKFLWVLQISDEVRSLLQMRYPHIFVDEYQDTNHLQVSILKQLITPESYLTVVGDDTQSIYSFQGSEVTKIRHFARDFEGADVVVLNENYRSSPPLVAYVNALNATCSGALTKTLISRGPRSEIKPRRAIFNKESQEANWIVKEIERLNSEEQIPLSEIAVLFRIGSIAAPLEKKLLAAELPFTREGGIKFVDLKHIQFFISFLELLENPFDWLAWEVLLPAIPNIGEKLTEIIIRDLQSNRGNWTWETPPVFSLGRGKRLESLLNFWRDMLEVSRLKRTTVREYLEAVLPVFKGIYARYFHITPKMLRITGAHQLPDRMEDHIQDIKDYILDLSTSYIGLMKDFIGEVVSSPDQRERRRGLTLSTIHSAKGLEWMAVFVIGNIESILPSAGFGLERNDLEEERRLYYVACSRAKKYLYITAAYKYVMPDNPQRYKGQVSRFADDPRTIDLLQRIKETNNDPFTAVNPHRRRNYLLALPTPDRMIEAQEVEPAQEIEACR
jgi:DNA helicase II / ATP-dependent DNA helicase PcrA